VPKVAVIILPPLILMAIFADFMALHDPEIGDPRQRREKRSTPWLVGR
jgi:hypothetical protein